MAPPTDPKEAAIYHTILSDLHRMQAIVLNLRSMEVEETEVALREHFGRDRSLVLARLNEWRQRRKDIYDAASADFGESVAGASAPPGGS